MNALIKWLNSKSPEKLEQEANGIYQIQEYDGKIWLTCNGVLVCPVDLFINKPVEILQEIRKLYVERNVK